MKHTQRVEREAEEDKEKKALAAQNTRDLEEIKKIKLQVKDAVDDQEAELRKKLEKLVGDVDERNERLAYMEKHKKLNADNMCHVVEERTILTDNPNVTPLEDVFPKAAERMKKDQKEKQETIGPSETGLVEMQDYGDFVEMYADTMEEYLHTQGWDKSREVLHKHGGVLLHQHSQTYCLLDCLEQEMNGYRDQMKLSSRQSQILSSITEWATTTKKHPRDVVPLFFGRMAGGEAGDAFQKGVDDFIEKIKVRAIDKRKEMQEEEKRERIKQTPGGLDPAEVMEELPAKMREAFESQDIPMLHEVLGDMEEQEARMWMDKCIKSGLWNAPADDDDDDDDDK